MLIMAMDGAFSCLKYGVFIMSDSNATIILYNTVRVHGYENRLLYLLSFGIG